ncbi:hypothetical protein ACLGIH_04270 [Streptomyces sp. HMX87]|uniref:hypothetical protein n=1 Tax=Streptomyces sp. HMX87 TaxID=3390849 RepID=UPI003A83C7E4
MTRVAARVPALAHTSPVQVPVLDALRDGHHPAWRCGTSPARRPGASRPWRTWSTWARAVHAGG